MESQNVDDQFAGLGALIENLNDPQWDALLQVLNCQPADGASAEEPRETDTDVQFEEEGNRGGA
jgi:hypothetical protein